MRRLIAVLVLGLFITSCSEDEKEVYSQSAKDNSLGEVLVLDVFEQVLTITPNYIVDGEYTADTTIAISASPILSDPTYPKIITINYGDGVTGEDGKTREGKLKITINSGTVLTESLSIEFDDYVCNGNTMIGELNFEYANSGGVVSYDGDHGADPIVMVSANGTMKWSGDFSMTRSGGEITPEVSDDTYLFSGNTSGIDLSGRSYSVLIQTNHTIDFSCNHYIKAGVSQITPNDKDPHTVDYGQGGCDGIGSVSLSENATENFTF